MALSTAFLFPAGNLTALAAHALRDLSLAESAPKKAGMEEALGPPDEDALLGSATRNWQAQVKQGKTVNLDAVWAALGSKPPEQAERQGLLAALHETPGDVFVVEDELLKGRSIFQGELGLWIGEEAARQAGAAKLLLALQTGDFSSLSAVREPEGKPSERLSPVPVAKPAAAPVPASQSPKPAKPAPKITPAPEVTAAEPDEKPKERSGNPFPELLEEILDPSAAHRNDRNWSDLVERLFSFYERDEKPGVIDSPGRKVRLTALRAYRRVTSWPGLSVQEVLRKTRGEVVETMVGGQLAFFKDRLAKPEELVRNAAIVAAKVWETAEEDKHWGEPPSPRPLDGALPIPEYMRRFRERLIFDSRGKEMTEIPVYTLGFLGQANQDIGKPEPLGILSILAARQFGQVPTTRSFPELAEGLLNGVERIEYLPPVPGAPPSLRIHFRKTVRDPYSKIEYKVLVVALLAEPWPDTLPAPPKPWAELSDEELVESAALSMERELRSVEFSEEKVRPFALDPNAFALIRLAEQGLLITRSQYAIELRKPEWERLASWMTRDPKNRAATLRFMTFLSEKTDLDTYEKLIPRVTPQQREEFLHRADVRSQAIGLLAGLGVSAEEVFDPESLRRAEEVVLRLRASKGEPFSLRKWDLYSPLLSLVIARKEDPQRSWVLSSDDVTTVLNRIAKFRSSLLEEERLDLLRAAADALSGLDRQFFLREINRLALRAIPVKPERPFRSATMEEADRALEGNPLLSGLAAADKRQEELLRTAQSLREAVWRHLEAVDAEESPGKTMEKEIGALEENLRELQLPASLARRDVPRVPLEDFFRFAAAVEKIKPAPLDAGRPAELDLYRDLLELRRTVDSGQIQEALDQIAGLLPKFEEEQAGKLQRLRERLEAQRIQESSRLALEAKEAELERRLLEEQAAAIEKKRQEDLKRKQKEETKAARRQQGESEPVQRAAKAVLDNADQLKLLSPRAQDLLKEIQDKGWSGKPDKVQSLLAVPAGVRLKNPKVLGDPLLFSFYKALLEVAKLHREAAPEEETQAGAEERAETPELRLMNEILDAAGVPTSQLPARQQRQLDRDL